MHTSVPLKSHLTPMSFAMYIAFKCGVKLWVGFLDELLQLHAMYGCQLIVQLENNGLLFLVLMLLDMILWELCSSHFTKSVTIPIDSSYTSICTDYSFTP